MGCPHLLLLTRSLTTVSATLEIATAYHSCTLYIVHYMLEMLWRTSYYTVIFVILLSHYEGALCLKIGIFGCRDADSPSYLQLLYRDMRSNVGRCAVWRAIMPSLLLLQGYLYLQSATCC